MPKVSSGLARGVANAGLAIVTVPIYRSCRAVLDAYRTIRKGGLVWLVIKPILLLRFLPFTLIASTYYWYCRLRSLTRAVSYSRAIFYTSEGCERALRNLLVDLDRQCRRDERKLEVIVASNLQPGAFFAAATLFPAVSDVHFYSDKAQLRAELPYFEPIAEPDPRCGSDQFIDLDDYSDAAIVELFSAGSSLHLPGLIRRNGSLHTLLSVQPKHLVLALNLPATGSACRHSWASYRELIDLLRSLEGQYLFLFLSKNEVTAVEQTSTGHVFHSACQLGMDFLDCLWVVRNVDAYIGMLDEYGLMTIGTNVPAVLFFDLGNEPDVDGEENEPSFQRNVRGQRLAKRPPTERQIFDEVRLMLSGIPV